jgi:glycosyltransferase involved in cell wall biosynthesis
MPSTIYINGRFLTQKVTGIQRYGREMLAALDQLLAQGPDLGLTFKLLVPHGTPVPALQAIGHQVVGTRQGHLWEQIDLWWASRDGVLFSFASTGPLLHARQVVTVHDASVYRVPDAFSWKFRLWYRFLLNALVRRSSLTLVVSEFARQEVQRFFGGKPQGLVVTSEGWQHLQRVEPQPSPALPPNLASTKYYLAVSSPTPNKNFGLIVQALRTAGTQDIQFLIAGSHNAKVFGGEGASTPDSAQVKYLGYVSDADLLQLYRHAHAFVFPSRYEGFGIPPLEAMSQGCPVLAARIDSVQEVCGDSALYFDPDSPESLLEALRMFEAHPTVRQTLAARAHDRAAQFSWESAARAALTALQRYAQSR